MAKKKQFSPKQAVVVAGAIVGILWMNITSFEQYQKDQQAQATQATKSLLTKVNLRNVLGSSTDTDVVTNDETQFKKKPQVSYWYTVLSQRPDYRDAHVILATLAYNDRRCALAQTQLSQAYTLDPNMPKDMPLVQAITKCGK